MINKNTRIMVTSVISAIFVAMATILFLGTTGVITIAVSNIINMWIFVVINILALLFTIIYLRALPNYRHFIRTQIIFTVLFVILAIVYTLISVI